MHLKRVVYFLGVSTLAVNLVSCIDAKRFGDRYATNLTEVHNPQFQECEHRINQAYASMNYVRAYKLYQADYDQWTYLNELLGQAESAQINRQYAVCESNAKEIVGYVRNNIAFDEWRRDLNGRFGVGRRSYSSYKNKNHHASGLKHLQFCDPLQGLIGSPSQNQKGICHARPGSFAFNYKAQIQLHLDRFYG